MENAANKTIQTVDAIQARVVAFLTDYGFQIVGGLIILVMGVIVAGWLGKVLNDWLEKRQLEPPIRMLSVRVARLLVFGLALVLALEKVGVPIAPVIAGISVAGVGIGLAMQGVLGNLVAGISITIYKPFRLGDTLQVATPTGTEIGVVEAISLGYTTLRAPDGRLVVLPNSVAASQVVLNARSRAAG